MKKIVDVGKQSFDYSKLACFMSPREIALHLAAQVLLNWECLKMPEITKVLYHNPATIIFWGDGTKTISKCSAGEEYNKKIGFLLCWLKKMNELCEFYTNINKPLNYWWEKMEED